MILYEPTNPLNGSARRGRVFPRTVRANDASRPTFAATAGEQLQQRVVDLGYTLMRRATG